MKTRKVLLLKFDGDPDDLEELVAEFKRRLIERDANAELRIHKTLSEVRPAS